MIIKVDVHKELTDNCFCKKCNRDVEKVDVYWHNGCNEEGEDYSEIHIDCGMCDSEITYISKWGETLNLDEAIESL